MRVQVFLSGVLVLAIGIVGTQFMPKMPGFEFLRGALTLGGALLICGFFMIRMPWHGIIGAGIVSLLGAAKGVMGLKDLPDFLSGDRSRGIAPLVEIGITVICVILLMRVLKILSVERTRRMLEADNQRGG